MTKKELEKEAVESAEKFFGKPNDLVDLDNLRIFKNGYLASAEPRERRIAELEKENAELQHKVDTLQGFLDRDVEFDNLQKENAGLKEQLRFAKEMPYSAVKEFAEEKTQYQLTKAKELLKKLYEETRGYMNDQGFDMNVINEVYDFIKSEVEK